MSEKSSALLVCWTSVYCEFSNFDEETDNPRGQELKIETIVRNAIYYHFYAIFENGTVCKMKSIWHIEAMGYDRRWLENARIA